jgi:hypothetical protein
MSIQKCGRQILIHGLALVLVGLVWGLMVPHTPHPRLALGAHIQFVTNGMLFTLMAVLVLKLPHAVGTKSGKVMLVAAYLTWAMALSEIANAWWGTNQVLSITANQAGVMGGTPWQELLVKVTHISAGVGLIGAWALLMAGFFSSAPIARREE